MRYRININISVLFLTVVMSFPVLSQASEQPDSINPFFYVKKENISGAVFKGNQEREELINEFTRYKEKIYTGSAKYRWENRFWNFQEFKQETFRFNFETGFLSGSGNWLDSTAARMIDADYKILGLRTNAAVNFSSRFYYDHKNYTLVQINAWGRYDLFRKNSDGNVQDSDMVVSDYERTVNKDKFRYGFEAKAGWGLGKLKPVNYIMTAEYLLDKYYKQRVFSDNEIFKFAEEIGRIKQRRNLRSARLPEKEVQLINEFLRSEMMLKAPEYAILNDWQLGEFLPRFDGTRYRIWPIF